MLHTLSKQVQKLYKKYQRKLALKEDVIAHYDFVQPRAIGGPVLPGDVPPMTINWVIPRFAFGAGGHTTIFRFVHYLEEQGFDCRVVVVGSPRPLAKDKIHRQINEWFFPFNGQVYIGMEAAPPARITIATSWLTAYYVRDFQSTLHRAYFVQDFEPYFHAAGSDYAWAEATYNFGFIGITAGTWLKEKLAAEYGMRTQAFLFSFDRSKYFLRARRAPEMRQIFFYARPKTERRGFEMGLLVLNEVKRRLPDVQIVMAGGKIDKFHIPFEHMSMGILDANALATLYGQCDAALVLSFTNLSLLPLELMACGTPVVSNKAPCTEWLLNDENACLCAPTVEALADGLCAVLNNPTLAARLRQRGLAEAAATDWQAEARKIGQFLHAIEA